MDEDTLSSLTELVSGSQPPKVRTAAATAVAAATAGEGNAAARAAVGKWRPLLRRLLALRGDSASGRFVLSALVNIAEDQDAARELVRLRAVSTCAISLLDAEERQMAPLHAALLANLTRTTEGVDALTGAADWLNVNERRLAEAKLLRLSEKISALPHVLFMANACSTPRGREVLLSAREGDSRKQPLSALLDLLRDQDKDRRLAAASALRNCALAEASHAALLRSTNVLGVALARLITPNHPIPSGDLVGAPKEVIAASAAPSSNPPEPHAEIRLMIVEALLLLCQSKAGRDALRSANAYPVLREWHLEEKDEGVRGAVEQIVERTQLLQEDDKIEGPRGSLSETTVQLASSGSRSPSCSLP